MEVLEPVLTSLIVKSYEGDFEEETRGCYDGNGTAQLDNGTSYEGEFNRGILHGIGVLTWPDGVVYEGQFTDGMISGKGVYRWPDGSVYTGEVKNGKRDGYGNFIGSGGQVYEGGWKDGFREGEGKMIYNVDKTVVYTGSWLTGMRHGYGIMRYTSGNQYDGYWEQDKKCGRGVMVWRDSDEVYIGEWKDDKCEGEGEHIWGESKHKTVQKLRRNLYRGEWKAGARNGHGTFFYADGSQYTGTWKNNMKDGEGTFSGTNGSIYRGSFLADHYVEALAERQTENVSVQVKLNISDLYQRFPGSTGKSVEWEEQTTQNLEKLFLRYHSQMKVLYRRYTDMAQRARSKQKIQPANDMSKIDLASFKARDFSKRMFSMTLKQFLLFPIETGLIGPYLSETDVLNTFKRMRLAHRIVSRNKALEIAMQKIGDKFAALVASASATEISEIELKITNLEHEARKLEYNSQQVEAINVELAATKQFLTEVQSKAPPPMSQEELRERGLKLFELTSLPDIWYRDDYYNTSDESDILLDTNQPLSEYEFCELIVRVLAEYAPQAWGPISIYDAVFKFLSCRLLPLLDEIVSVKKPSSKSFLSEFSLCVSSEPVTLALEKNEKKLRGIWESIVANSGQKVIKLSELLRFFESLQKTGSVISEASPWTLLHTLAFLPAHQRIDEISIVPETTVATSTDVEPGSVEEQQTEIELDNSYEATVALAAKIRFSRFGLYPNLADVTTEQYDASSLLREVSYPDFLDMLVRLLSSELWVSQEELRSAQNSAFEAANAVRAAAGGGENEDPNNLSGGEEATSSTPSIVKAPAMVLATRKKTPVEVAAELDVLSILQP